MSEKPVRNILVVVKARVAAAAALGKTICEWLRKRGSHVQMLFAGLELAPYLTPPVDLIVVLGGDGTILGVARKVVGLEIPLVCINFGRVGFLSDIEPEDWEKGLEEVLDTDYCRRTTALAWQLTRYGHVVGKGFAVNDVVLSRAAMARLVCADIFVNNELMGSVRRRRFPSEHPHRQLRLFRRRRRSAPFPRDQGRGLRAHLPLPQHHPPHGFSLRHHLPL